MASNILNMRPVYAAHGQLVAGWSSIVCPAIEGGYSCLML